MPTLLHNSIGAELTAQRYPQYDIGVGTYSVPGYFSVLDWHQGSTLRIGAYCSIAYGVRILLGGDHRTDWVTTYPFSQVWGEARHFSGHPTTRGDVIIGNDVWLGFNALITSGVTIGDGAVIAANAVVSTNIPPYTIAAGNPAKAVRQRFDDSTVERLLKLKWWTWPPERIERFLPLMLSDTIDRFLEEAEKTAGP